MDLGKAIKMCRQSKALTQSELAQRLQISTPYLSQIEMNKRIPNMGLVKKVSDELHIPLSILIFIASDKDDIDELNQDIIDKLSAIAYELMKDDRK